MRFSAVLSMLALCATPAISWAATSQCPDNLAGGMAPDLLNPRMTQGTRELCYPGFVVLHSSRTRTPLWSAEHLTAQRIQMAHGTPRINDFHADANLPPGEGAELEDYARSGYDRGHMSPSGDAPDAQSQDATFTLANMIPQNPDNNRNLWEGIEAATRNLALHSGDVYVVTGPIFAGSRLQSLHNRVLIPTQIFKAVYDVSHNQAGVYLVNNAAGMAWQPISVEQLQALSGIDPFPALPQSVKSSIMNLPLPEPHGRHQGVPPTTLDTNAPALGQAAPDEHSQLEHGTMLSSGSRIAEHALGYMMSHHY